MPTTRTIRQSRNPLIKGKTIQSSKWYAKDPTYSLRLEKEYEKELVTLFTKFKEGSLKIYRDSAGIRDLESPPVMFQMYEQSMEQWAQIIVNAGAGVVKEHTLKAYNHGTTFASMTLKRGGHPAFKFMPDIPQGVSFAFTGPNKASYEAMLRNNLNDLTKVTDEIKSIIKREMLTGIEKSETTIQIMRRIRDAADLGKKRATLIARTEVMKAVNQGAKERYTEAGVRTEWLTTHDERLCDECFSLDGKLTPEDTGGLPPRHPNCRCCVLPVAYGSDK
jgi:SPP1 gp7 family putative phage head morphogenesis protein